MKIGKPQISYQDDKVVFSTSVSWAAGETVLWYRTQKCFADLLGVTCDAPLVALLIPAMAAHEDIEVEGALSERLWYNVSGPYQHLLRHVIPELTHIAITAADLSRPTPPPPGVATGFSGGIDSFCTIADHYFSDVQTGFRLTHLLFNNVGSHGDGGQRLFRERFSKLKPVADRIGLPFVMVDTNVAQFYINRLGFQLTHTPRNASVALLLQGGIGRFMYSSAYSYPEVSVGDSYDMAYIDTIALPLLSTERLDAFSVGSEYSRVEKTLRLADLRLTREVLDVCAEDRILGNCSRCWKCLRTLLTLDIAGVLDRFALLFDLKVYNRYRKRYMGEVLGSTDPLLKEIVELARRRNFIWPLESWLYAYWLRLPNPVRWVLKLPINAVRVVNRRHIFSRSNVN